VKNNNVRILEFGSSEPARNKGNLSIKIDNVLNMVSEHLAKHCSDFVVRLPQNIDGDGSHTHFYTKNPKIPQWVYFYCSNV
jgi:hypothetical protein